MMNSKDINILNEAYDDLSHGQYKGPDELEPFARVEPQETHEERPNDLNVGAGKFPTSELTKALKFMLDSGNSVMVDTHTGSANIEEYVGDKGNITFMASTEDGESVDVSPDDIVRIVGMDKMDDTLQGLPDEPTNDHEDKSKINRDSESSMGELMSRGAASTQRAGAGSKGPDASPNFGQG